MCDILKNIYRPRAYSCARLLCAGSLNFPRGLYNRSKSQGTKSERRLSLVIPCIARILPGPTLVVSDPWHGAAAPLAPAVRHVALLVAVHAALPCLQKLLHLSARIVICQRQEILEFTTGLGLLLEWRLIWKGMGSVERSRLRELFWASINVGLVGIDLFDNNFFCKVMGPTIHSRLHLFA